jgi:hypothetical protein
MTYEQVFPDFKSLRDHVDTITGQKVLPFSDFGKAVFGYKVFDLDPEFDGVACKSREDHLRSIEIRNSRAFKIYVWEKFGRELVSETISVSSIEELFSYEETNKANELYRINDGQSISIIDYGKATDGVSVLITLTQEAFVNRNLVEAIKFPAVTWMQTLGFIGNPLSILSNKIPPNNFNQTPRHSRPAPSEQVQQIRPRFDLSIRSK